MRGRRFLAGWFAGVAFYRLHALLEQAELALQSIDFMPLADDGFVQFFDCPVLMAQPDFKFRDAGFSVGFFSVSGHDLLSSASFLLASGERRFTAYSAFDASERVS